MLPLNLSDFPGSTYGFHECKTVVGFDYPGKYVLVDEYYGCGMFSNLYKQQPFLYQNQMWSTSEAAYQASKFPG